MFSKKIEDVYNPIVYIFLALAISSIYYGMNGYFRELATLVVVLFFLFIFYYCGIRFSLIMILFFCVGIYINHSYYNIPHKINGILRIVKIDSYETIAEYNGRKISLKCKDEELKTGELYLVDGLSKNNSDKSKGIVCELEAQYIRKSNDDFISKLYNMKRDIYDDLKENLGERKAAIISAVSFGYSDYLSDEDKDEMRYYGIIHSISVSGLHVAIVYAFLKLCIGAGLGLLSTLLYVIFTGAGYASIRAYVMLSSIEGSHIFNKNNNSLSALSLSSIILLIYKPYSIFEISFHLSYLAVLGIILFNKKINYAIYRVPDKIRDVISITLSAQIFVFPYLILIFKDFSINFILGNLILIPFINIIVIMGNLLVLFYKVKFIFDYMSYIVLYILKIFDWLLNKISIYSFDAFYGNEYVVFFYLFLLLSLYFIKRGYKKFMYLPAVAVLIIILQSYNPIFNIKYYNEGAILINYKGEKVLISNKKEIDIEKLMQYSGAEKVYRKAESIKLDNKYEVKLKGKDYILVVGNKEYILKISADKNEYKYYDIINFKDGPITKIFIIDDKVIGVC